MPLGCSLLAVSGWCIHLVSLEEQGPELRGHSRSRTAGTERPRGGGTGRDTDETVGLAERRQGMGKEVMVQSRAEFQSSGQQRYLEGLPVLALLTPLPKAGPLPLLLLLPLQSSDVLLKADQCIFLVHV